MALLSASFWLVKSGDKAFPSNFVLVKATRIDSAMWMMVKERRKMRTGFVSSACPDPHHHCNGYNKFSQLQVGLTKKKGKILVISS